MGIRALVTALALSVLALTALALTGCAGGGASSAGRGDGVRTPANIPPGVVFDGPVAVPAVTAQQINASVRAVIEPLGTIPFDGLVLPLVSPDGMTLVTQAGTPPTWETAIAVPGAEPSLRTYLELYDISSAPPRRKVLTVAIPAGVLLGRSSTNQGFLVEEPRPDGSRRIGLASWDDGAIRWLADEPGVVFSGGVLTTDGDLLASRRPVQSDEPVLWSRRRGEIASTSQTAYLFPIAGAVPEEAGVFAVSQELGTQLQWWSLRGGQPVVRVRRSIASGASARSAYNAVDPLRSRSAGFDPPAPGALLFNPRAGRVVLFDPDSADLLPLASKSISAAWAPDEAGWAVILSTPDGLAHQRLVRRRGVWEALPAAKILADPYVPRATSNPDRPFVLVGPDGPGISRNLRIVGLRLLAGDE